MIRLALATVAVVLATAPCAQAAPATATGIATATVIRPLSAMFQLLSPRGKQAKLGNKRQGVAHLYW